MKPDADIEYVERIIEYLKPLNNPYPHDGNPEESVALEVQLAIDQLRYEDLPRKYQSEADRSQLVSLLRQFEYNEWADAVKRRGFYTVSPPPRSNAKYFFAIQAAHLMREFTGREANQARQIPGDHFLALWRCDRR